MPGMNKLDSSGEPLSWNTAYNIVELQESFDRINTIVKSRLCTINSSAKLEDTLHDIGEELRHIRYHLDDIRYFNYLK